MELKDENIVSATDVARFSHELTYFRYLMNNSHVKSFFKELSIPEYIVLHNLSQADGITYLKDLSESMQLSVRQVSNLVGELRDRGLLTWAHDGDGSEGTYVSITETGENVLHDQESTLIEYYGKVIKSYGKDNLVQLLRLMKELESVMGNELEDTDNDRTDK